MTWSPVGKHPPWRQDTGLKPVLCLISGKTLVYLILK